MSKAPYFKFFVSDFIGDTMHLTAEEVGAYVLLLCAMWNAGGSLPNDPKRLARAARVTTKRWHFVWPNLAPFFDDDGERITQKRLSIEAERVRQISSDRSTAGKSGVEAKALKNNKPASANADDLLEQKDSNSSSTRARSKPEPEPDRERDKSLPLGELALDGAGAPPGKGSRLPADWRPSPEAVSYARQQGFGEPGIKRIAENFRDYWIAASGANAVKRDWTAAWRTWVRREAERHPPQQSSTGRQDWI